jgi:hypothetical protein
MRALICLLLLVTSNCSAFEIFGPKTFEDCLLQNLKGVNSTEAVNAITAACSIKFNKSASDNSSDGIKKCFVYWDGTQLVLGDKKPSSSFTTFRKTYNDVPILDISFPNVMTKSWGADRDKNADIFFNTYYQSIRSICGWNF